MNALTIGTIYIDADNVRQTDNKAAETTGNRLRSLNCVTASHPQSTADRAVRADDRKTAACVTEPGRQDEERSYS